MRAVPVSLPVAIPTGRPVHATALSHRREVRELPDPDGVGTCPKNHSPVTWRGLDSNRQPMWRHEDGSITVRVVQDYTHTDGKLYRIPRVVVAHPAKTVRAPDSAGGPK